MNSEYSHCRVTYTMTPPMAIGIRADSSIVMPLPWPFFGSAGIAIFTGCRSGRNRGGRW